MKILEEEDWTYVITEITKILKKKEKGTLRVQKYVKKKKDDT